MIRSATGSLSSEGSRSKAHTMTLPFLNGNSPKVTATSGGALIGPAISVPGNSVIPQYPKAPANSWLKTAGADNPAKMG